MARFVEPAADVVEEWNKWVAERSPAVREVANRFEPWTLYRLRSTGHRVHVIGFDENKDDTVTLKVVVSGRFNFVVFDRIVFGIDPDDAEECDLPLPGEELGTIFYDQEGLDVVLGDAKGK